MSVGWESGLLGFVASVAGLVAAVLLVKLPADLLLHREPTLTAEELKRAQPRRAWVVDYFLPASFFVMLMLFMLPSAYVTRALAGLDRARAWPVECGVFAFVFFQWIFLPMAGLELAAGITMSLRSQPPKSSQTDRAARGPGWISSPEVWRVGVLRLALTLAAFGGAAGVVEAFRP